MNCKFVGDFLYTQKLFRIFVENRTYRWIKYIIFCWDEHDDGAALVIRPRVGCEHGFNRADNVCF